MNILQMSFAGAVMILVVVIIRMLCIHKLPKVTFMVLWGFVLIRLLIPISVPSAFSAYSLLQKYLPEKYLQQNYLQEFSLRAANVFNTAEAANVSKSAGKSDLTGISKITDVMETPDNSVAEAGTAEGKPAPSVWVVFWLAGMLICTGYFSVVYFRCRREFEMSLPVENEIVKRWQSEHSLKYSGACRTLAIRQSDCISAPISYGIVHPVILLPKTTNWNDTDTLQYVLEHEFVHIQRYDMLTKLWMTAAVCIHWFNPLVWVMYTLFSRDIEISCDETVVRYLGSDRKSAYARILINMEEKKNGLAYFYNGFSNNAMKERIEAIMKMKKNSKMIWFLAAVLVIGVVAVFGTTAGTAFAYTEAESTTVVSTAADIGLVENSAEDSETTLLEPEAQRQFQNQDQYQQWLKEWEKYGVSVKKNGEMYFHGERIRYFLDGYEMDGNVISHHQYYDAKGTVDVHTVRNDIQNGDGSTQLFGEIVDIVAYPQEEFDKRDYSWVLKNDNNEAVTEETGITNTYVAELFEDSVDVPETSNKITNDIVTAVEDLADEETATTYYIQQATEDTLETSVAEGNSSDSSGQTLEERFAAYEKYGITYKNASNGRGNVYLDGKPVKQFIDIGPDGTFTYISDDGTLIVIVVYDDSGKVVGLESWEETKE